MPIPPAAKGQFTGRTKQVLDSGDEKEAAGRLVAAAAELKQGIKDLSLPEDVRRELDGIDLS